MYDQDEIVDSPIGDEQLDSDYQSIVFYVVRVGDVSTTTKSIGVIVKPTDADTSSDPIIFSNNNNSNKNKFATFSVRPTIYYTKSNTKFWNVTFTADVKQQVDDSQYTNYYLAPWDDEFNFVRSQIIGPGLDLRNNVVALIVDVKGALRSIYMWDIGQVSTHHGLGWAPYVTATVNDVPGAFTITRTWQKNKKWGHCESGYQCGFKIYDQYGNSGLFFNYLDSGLYGALSSGLDIYEYLYDITLVT